MEKELKAKCDSYLKNEKGSRMVNCEGKNWEKQKGRAVWAQPLSSADSLEIEKGCLPLSSPHRVDDSLHSEPQNHYKSRLLQSELDKWEPALTKPQEDPVPPIQHQGESQDISLTDYPGSVLWSQFERACLHYSSLFRDMWVLMCQRVLGPSTHGEHPILSPYQKDNRRKALSPLPPPSQHFPALGLSL